MEGNQVHNINKECILFSVILSSHLIASSHNLVFESVMAHVINILNISSQSSTTNYTILLLRYKVCRILVIQFISLCKKQCCRRTLEAKGR